MADTSKAWIWEQYQGVVEETAKHNSDSSDDRVVRFQTIKGSRVGNMDQRSNEARAKFGAAIAISIFVGAFFPTVAILLFAVAVLLVASGKEPERTTEVLGKLPVGEHIAKALNHVDRWLS